MTRIFGKVLDKWSNTTIPRPPGYRGCSQAGFFFNPSNAEATFVQSTRTQIFLKTIQTLSCWYSLDSSRGVLSDEYPFARVSVIFQDFCINLYWPK